jgi:phosphonopyruvate decarboxylase
VKPAAGEGIIGRMTGEAFARLLDAAGYDVFTGVPCSLVESLIGALERRRDRPYVPAVREDVAVGIAAGAWLAGRTPAVLMQNSGLGTGLNALVSLSLLYRLPALLLVTWRGHGGRDAPEHLLMGEVSPRLLDLVGLPHRVPSAASLAGDVRWARDESERRERPVALLLPPGLIATGPGPADAAPVGPPPRPAAPAGSPEAPLRPELSRYAALRAAIGALGDEPVVHANGYICRESHAVKDRPQNFYMVGSMGCAAAIALGVALARPRRKTVVFDGDGNLLMSLGVLAMIGGGPVPGDPPPANLVHVVFDNEVYGSTGNQRSPAGQVRLDRLAAAAGYATACAATSADGIRDAVAAALSADGPAFVLAKVTAVEEDVPRIPYAPEAIRDRFRAALGEP